MDSLSVTERTRINRHAERQSTDTSILAEILDEAPLAHVACCIDGAPLVLPMACAQDGTRLLLHGSTGARLMRAAAAGHPLAVAISLLDGLVYARTLFDSSMNYRSVVVYGRAHTLEGKEKLIALHALSEHLMPGRWTEVRSPTSKELAATSLLGLPLDECSVKIRGGGPSDDEEDPTVWAGLLPVCTLAGTPKHHPACHQVSPSPNRYGPVSRQAPQPRQRPTEGRSNDQRPFTSDDTGAAPAFQ